MTDQFLDIAMGYWALARLKQAVGDFDEALNLLQKLDNLNLDWQPAPGFLKRQIDTLAMDLRLLLGQQRSELKQLFVDVDQWIETGRLDANDRFDYVHESDYAVLAQMLVLSERFDEALPLLDHLAQASDSSGRVGRLIHYLTLKALAHFGREQTEPASATLARALILAEPEGYVRTFVDMGPSLQLLLQQTAVRTLAPDYIDRLLAAFPDGPRKSVSTGSPKPSTSLLIEPLKKREMDVLRLMAAGLSNREIALELNLAVSTVKWYARQIYGKLGVNKRANAVSRARELNLIS